MNKKILGILLGVLILCGLIYSGLLGLNNKVNNVPPPPVDSELTAFYEKALDYEEQIKSDKNNMNAYLDGAINWKTVGDISGDKQYYDAAINLYERGADIFGQQYFVFWLNIGNLQKLVGRNEPAESAYREG